MPWGWFDHKHDHSGEWTGFLEQGVKLDGKLESQGTFRINSEMKGTLVSQEMLILGEKAAVEGEIQGNQVIVAGRFDGTIRAAKKVEIQTKGIITGDVYSPCVIVEPGAVFEGQCHIVPPGEDARVIVIAMRSAATSN
ncbi:MAG: polymer-forming cytoskeletal protein [Terriglobales bacterium]|jgi:cytoskeletal protein CcmA (bactofilin family)